MNRIMFEMKAECEDGLYRTVYMKISDKSVYEGRKKKINVCFY